VLFKRKLQRVYGVLQSSQVDESWCVVCGYDSTIDGEVKWIEGSRGEKPTESRSQAGFSATALRLILAIFPL
jgi:hypothetical protein